MGDFLLDLRPKSRRAVLESRESLRFQRHLEVHSISNDFFDAVITTNESPELWAPYSHPDGTRIVALAGRVALDAGELRAGEACPGEGGLACKALSAKWEKGGPGFAWALSGNFVLILFDRARRALHLVTDCTGVLPAFEAEGSCGAVLGSHPDVLARVAGLREDLDELSLGEFALTGTVSPPYTYYRSIRHVGRAIQIDVSFDQQGAPTRSRRCYFPLCYRGDPTDREEDLAHELGEAFRSSVERRTRSEFGRCAIALSGGLDSRTVLASVASSADVLAFTCFDEPNLELRTARALAAAAGVGFHPFQREFEYYGRTAAEGMRISGGMGTFANNHFLGVLPWLREQGARVLLTGCYCDYLFKALPLNRRANPITGHEELADFKPEFYFSHVWPDTPLAREVRDRVLSRFPESLTRDRSDAAVFELECLRTFPLSYEGDNAQRLVPQRLTGWFVPVSDPGLLQVYCRIPYRWKLNRSIFTRAVRSVCGKRFDAIPDANTGARLDAGAWLAGARFALARVGNRLRRMRPSIATQGSWPDWEYYAAHSPIMAGFARLEAPWAHELFTRALGSQLPSKGTVASTGRTLWTQIQLLTLQLWWNHRA